MSPYNGLTNGAVLRNLEQIFFNFFLNLFGEGRGVVWVWCGTVTIL